MGYFLRQCKIEPIKSGIRAVKLRKYEKISFAGMCKLPFLQSTSIDKSLSVNGNEKLPLNYSSIVYSNQSKSITI